jgi:glycosyltransferase involved in cell wall biosynthesis
MSKLPIETQNSTQPPVMTVIVPVFNERENVVDTLNRILAVPLDLEIIPVDDCSTDGTKEILEKFASEHPRIRVIRHPYNMGNGASVKTGMRNAKAPSVMIIDADGQHPPEDIPKFFEMIKTYDLVVGQRTAGTDATFTRNLGNFIFNTFSSYVAGCKIPDLTCGMRAMRTQVALEFIDLFPNGFSLPATSTLSVIKAGYSIAWIPIVSPQRKGSSKIKPISDGSKFLMIIVRIAVFFKPLRVFLPISLFALFLGIVDFLATIFTEARLHISPFAGLMFQSFLLIFLMGLISEQIANLRFSGRR